jgi:hypothetical protein
MKYWTIAYPTDGGDVEETLSEAMILHYYFPHWSEQMHKIGKDDMISEELCLEDWVVVHWAWETESDGTPIEVNIVRGYN